MREARYKETHLAGMWTNSSGLRGPAFDSLNQLHKCKQKTTTWLVGNLEKVGEGQGRLERLPFKVSQRESNRCYFMVC